jgi:recombination protein RecA
MTKKTKDFMDAVEAKFEESTKDIIITQSDSWEAISTSSLSLDVSTGKGGFPRGKFTTIYGAESSGKTTLCLCSAKKLIEKGGKVTYIDLENQLDFEHVCDIIGEENIGSSFILVKPDTAENAFYIAELAIKSGEFDMIFFDSIAALSPKSELEGSIEDTPFATASRKINQFVRKNIYFIRLNKVAIVFVNQVRDLIGAFRKTYTMPGGHALKHFSSLIIYLTKKADIKVDGEQVGIVTEFQIKKNKIGSPFRSYHFPIIFTTGVDSLRDSVQFAEMLGVLKKSGPYYKFGEESLAIGLAKTMEFLKNNPLTLDKIEKACYNLTINNSIKEDEEYENDSDDEAL